ncbi:LytR/AlgR family response regulator transcription factor [Undibacterium macrobrachii]|uniref:DNA-binding response regulator n=1 Tax=Undibacterium macrobrachii TaxID=1119058 RepID=A0ABQ2XBU9_9BURK|nr:response regulator [Undibacterium macrobrachii]GGX08546.1 DNA-binding response regulator [Undibacterium macrobrachii]
MRVLIVDDERPARDKLRRLLAQESDILNISEARDGIEALDLIAAETPDVVFLDIQMPEVSGIELAASLPTPAPLIVFVTAYDQYAIRAFDTNAIDYLLKPYDQRRLLRALERVRERMLAQKVTTENSATKATSSSPASGLPVRQLLVSERGKTRVVKVEQIQWIETADNYVILHTLDAHLLLRQTLTGLLEQLGEAFVRCHRRAAVQTDYIETVVALEKGDCELVLRGGARVPCSRQFRASVMEKL